MNWFKLYAEFASDPKVQSMSEPMQRRLVMLYCLKCQGDLAKLDDEEIALALRITMSELEKTRELFRRKGFIGDRWSLPAWEKRQATTDKTAAERMRRMRANRAEPANGVTEPVTRNSRVTMRCETRNATNALRVEVEEEEEEEGEENSPLPLSIVLGPEYRAIGEFAIQLAADVSWGRWVDQQGLCGHSARDIRACLEECAGAGKLTQAYAASKLRGWAAEGGRPRRKGEDNGKTAVQQRPEETRARVQRPDLPRTPEFAEIHAMWDRIEGRAGG